MEKTIMTWILCAYSETAACLVVPISNYPVCHMNKYTLPSKCMSWDTDISTNDTANMI